MWKYLNYNEMNKHYFILLFCLVMTSCVQTEKNKSEVNQIKVFNDSIHKNSKQKFSLSDIQGIWTSDGEMNSLFSISNDTVTYTEHLDNKYLVNILNDSLIFNYDGRISKSKIIRLNKDTMILQDEFDEMPTTYYRFKN